MGFHRRRGAKLGVSTVKKSGAQRLKFGRRLATVSAGHCASRLHRLVSTGHQLLWR